MLWNNLSNTYKVKNTFKRQSLDSLLTETTVFKPKNSTPSLSSFADITKRLEFEPIFQKNIQSPHISKKPEN